MGIVKSIKRAPETARLILGGGVTLTATGAVNVTVPFLVDHVDFFPSSFRLDTGRAAVCIDPVVVDETDPADYILITHAHTDHFSLPDIEKLLKPETVVVCPQKPYKKLSRKLKPHDIRKITPGDTLHFDGLTVEAVAAYNMTESLMTPHPKKAQNVGYIITAGGVRIYHAGDTDYTPELEQLRDITAALVPIDGGNLTMTTEKSAELINSLKPRFAIPMHYNLGTAAVESFKNLVDKTITVAIMDGSVRYKEPG